MPSVDDQTYLEEQHLKKDIFEAFNKKRNPVY